MTVACCCGLILDNLIPGTQEERGCVDSNMSTKTYKTHNMGVYALPCAPLERVCGLFPCFRHPAGSSEDGDEMQMQDAVPSNQEDQVGTKGSEHGIDLASQADRSDGRSVNIATNPLTSPKGVQRRVLTSNASEPKESFVFNPHQDAQPNNKRIVDV